MRSRARQATLAAIAAAALAITASACEGAAQPAASTHRATRPGASPLKSLTSYQIIGKAFANTEGSLNVQITGKVTRSGQSTRLSSLSLVNGSSGCIGDIYQSQVGGTFQMIYDGTTAWILPSLDYWQAGGERSPAAVPAVEGKYLQVKPGGTSLGALVSLCSLTTLVGTGPSPARRTGFGAPTPTTVGTLAALKIPDTADGGYAIVTDDATPRLLRFFVPGRNGGAFSLSYSAVAVTVAPPPSTEVVDGSRYGF